MANTCLTEMLIKVVVSVKGGNQQEKNGHSQLLNWKFGAASRSTQA